MAITFDRKPVAKKPAQIYDISRKHAYAEQRLIAATDRYIAARTTASREKAHKWIHAWRAFRTSRRR
jgi:hypothetical protein